MLMSECLRVVSRHLVIIIASLRAAPAGNSIGSQPEEPLSIGPQVLGDFQGIKPRFDRTAMKNPN